VREPERPLLRDPRGAKVSDKLAVLEALAPHADSLAIGGAMAYTFLTARGEERGASRSSSPTGSRMRARGARGRAERASALLPTDHVVAEKIADGAPSRVVRRSRTAGWASTSARDRGRYADEAGRARTLFWNGPMGVFEVAAFANGHRRGRARGGRQLRHERGRRRRLARRDQQLGLGDRITHLSTGGGASLEYVQGLELPGVAALER
jgi:phosphoglycerate kinase